jgi:hypothetical protein
MGALLLMFQFFVLAGAVGVLAYAYNQDDRDLAIYGAYGLLAGLLLVVISWMLALRTNCPLCMMPVLVNKRCSRHGKAKTAFGSHRLRVALAILFMNSFTCPYCLETTAVRVRNRREFSRRSGSARR